MNTKMTCETLDFAGHYSLSKNYLFARAAGIFDPFFVRVSLAKNTAVPTSVLEKAVAYSLCAWEGRLGMALAVPTSAFAENLSEKSFQDFFDRLK